MSKIKAEISAITEDLMQGLSVIRGALDLEDPKIVDALASVETFCAISVDVLTKTNPSKIRSAATTAAIRLLLPVPPGNRRAD